MNLISFSGIGIILGAAVLFSRNRAMIRGVDILKGIAFQFFLAYLILCTSYGQAFFGKLANGFEAVCRLADQGAAFVFGNLSNAAGPWGWVFGVKVIPIIIFFGALTSVLSYLGLIQGLVGGIAWIVRPLLGTSGPETLCAAANSMLGPTESPLLIKHYLGRMTDSQLLVVMVSGMATLSGSILAVYGGMGVPMMHLLASSIMAVPGSIVISKMLLPDVVRTKDDELGDIPVSRGTANSLLDAIATGTSDGLNLAVNVAAMLISFISLIALINYLLGMCGGWCGYEISLDVIFGKLFSAVAYVIGIAPSDAEVAGALLGKKLVINEFVAYDSLVRATMSEKSRAILTYALCGFSNFSSIGIQIGGIGALVPNKRDRLIDLGFLALLGGTLANLLNAAIAALFIA